jgi:prolyl-tRNA synthetase
MAHSDDGGLVLPPKLAPIHVAIVPIWKSDAEKAQVLEASDKLARELRSDGLTVKLDDRDALRPGEKYYEWERKGVPVRLEVGPRDVASLTAMAKTRIADSKEKVKVPFEDIGVHVGKLLDDMQKQLFQRALAFRQANLTKVDSWSDFEAVFAGQNSKFVLAHWDGTTETELAIKEATKATIRCIPLPDEGLDDGAGQCIKTGKPSAQRVLFAKNY